MRAARGTVAEVSVYKEDDEDQLPTLLPTFGLAPNSWHLERMPGPTCGNPVNDVYEWTIETAISFFLTLAPTYLKYFWAVGA